jgi:hypothetical protein
MVPATGLEPVRCYSLEPESSASANSATRAFCDFFDQKGEAHFRTGPVLCKPQTSQIHRIFLLCHFHAFCVEFLSGKPPFSPESSGQKFRRLFPKISKLQSLSVPAQCHSDRRKPRKLALLLKLRNLGILAFTMLFIPSEFR